MDSLTFHSPGSLRRSAVDDFYVGESFLEWDHSHPFPVAAVNAHQQLSPPESFDIHTPLIKHGSSSHGGLQKTPVRQRAASNASIGSNSHFSPAEHGLVTPISMNGTPATFWAGQKLDFMTPTASRNNSTIDDYMNTPLQAPGPLAPTSPLFKSPPSASVSATSTGSSSVGTNPFYCLPVCMRTGSEPAMASPDASEDFEFKAKAASAAEEALANFEDPPKTRSRANSEAEDAPEKPFGCAHCTKCFRRMEHLRRHSKIHTKERPFSCQITDCGRKFSRSDNLKAHMKTHAKPTGRNIYVEGLDLEEVPVTPKRRKVD